jgi:hypothetical protein
MRSEAEPSRSSQDAREPTSYERDLTYAGSKLDAKGRSGAMGKRYFRRNVVLLTAVRLWSISFYS